MRWRTFGLFCSNSAVARPGPDSGFHVCGARFLLTKPVALGFPGCHMPGPAGLVWSPGGPAEAGARIGEQGVWVHPASERQGTWPRGSVFFWTLQLCRAEGEATADGSLAGDPCGLVLTDSRHLRLPYGTSGCALSLPSQPCPHSPGKLPSGWGYRVSLRSDPTLAPEGEAGLPFPAWLGAPRAFTQSMQDVTVHAPGVAGGEARCCLHPSCCSRPVPPSLPAGLQQAGLLPGRLKGAPQRPGLPPCPPVPPWPVSAPLRPALGSEGQRQA